MTILITVHPGRAGHDETLVSLRMQVPVRHPTTADADAMGSVHVRAWRAAYSDGLMPDEYLAALSAERRAEMWRRVLSESSRDRASRFVAEDPTGTVVGFALVGPEAEDDLATGGELYVINVDPDSWGTGVGPRYTRQRVTH